MGKITTRKIQHIYYVLLSIAVFSPHYLDEIPALDLISTLLRTASFVYFAMIYAKRGKFNKIVIYSMGIAIWTFLMTIIYENNIKNVFLRYVNILLVMMIFDLKDSDISLVLKASFQAAVLIIYANFIVVIAYPNGIYVNFTDWSKVWIIGQKQEFANVFIYATVIGALYLKKGMKNLFIYLLYAVMLYQAFVTGALGLLIVLVLSYVLIIIYFLRQFRINIKLLFAISVLLSVTVVMIFGLNDFIPTNIYNLLDYTIVSDVTKIGNVLSRFNIWKDGLYFFLKSYGLGMGTFNEEVHYSIALYSKYHPNFHNMIVEYLATGGVIALLFYLSILSCTAKSLDRSQSRQSVILGYLLFAYNILLIFEVYYSAFIMGLYILANNRFFLEERGEECR